MEEKDLLEHLSCILKHIYAWEIKTEYQRTLQVSAYKSLALLSRRMLEYSITRIDIAMEDLTEEDE